MMEPAITIIIGLPGIIFMDDGLRQFSSREGIRAVPHRRIIFDARDRRHEVRRTRTDQQVLCFVGLAITLDGHEFVRTTDHFRCTRYERAMFVVETLLSVKL